MKKQITSIIMLAALFLVGCSKDSNSSSPGTNNRNIKYEITGNYPGPLLVGYTDVSGSSKLIDVTSLPWTLSVTYPNSVVGIAIGANGTNTNSAYAGKEITMTITSGGTVVKTSTATTLNSGVLSAPAIAHVF